MDSFLRDDIQVGTSQMGLQDGLNVIPSGTMFALRNDDGFTQYVAMEQLAVMLTGVVLHMTPPLWEIEDITGHYEEVKKSGKYSGRTTAHEHKNDKTWRDYMGPFDPAIVTQVVFNVQWSECPVEVEEEVRRLWKHQELRNEAHFGWDRDDEYWTEDDDDDNPDDVKTQKEVYPIIDEYLKSKGVSQCQIYWWW